MRTPLTELIARLNALYDMNPMEPEYREGLADAIAEARLLLPIEQSHLRGAWNDGNGGILNQSATEYLNEVYDQKRE